MAYCTLRVQGPLQAQLMDGHKTLQGVPRPGHPHQKPTNYIACTRLHGELPTCGQQNRKLSWLYAKPPRERHSSDRTVETLPSKAAFANPDVGGRRWSPIDPIQEADGIVDQCGS